METVKALIQKSDNEARKAVSLIDAKFASLNPPFTARPDASAGALILAAQKAGSDNPFDELKYIRNGIPRALRKAKQPLSEASRFASALRDSAHAIEKGADVPASLPDELSFHVRVALLGAKAGTLDASGLANQLRTAAKAAEAAIHQADRDFRRFESAASIAAAKGASAYLISCGPQFDYYSDFYSEKAARLVEQHRKAFNPSALRSKRAEARKKPKRGRVVAGRTL